MNVKLFGDKHEDISSLAKMCGFNIVEKDPEFIITYGGDGTMVRSEIEYPGVPKIMLKNSSICKKCSPLPNEEVLKMIQAGSYRTEKMMKLQAEAKGKTLTAINEIVVHNHDPRHAIRYGVRVNGKAFHEEVIGDGIVISTPFGSTGYYRSITDSFFEVGLGLAFNNSTEQADHMVLKEDSVIELTINRGPAEVFADNDRESIELIAGDKVTIKRSGQFAQIICLEQA